MPVSAVGTDFLVNTTTSGHQTAPSVAALADGSFIATWVDGSASADDASGTAVRAQRYNAGGGKVGGEFLVNTTTAGNQTAPAVAGLSGGGFVVAWVLNAAVYGQRFAADGTKVGDEFPIGGNLPIGSSGSTYLYLSEGPYASAPVVTGLRDGGFAVTYDFVTLGVSGVSGRSYDANGVQVGQAFSLSRMWAGDAGAGAETSKLIDAGGGSLFLLSNPSGNPVKVAALAGGGFVAAWTTSGTMPGGDTDVRGQRFDAAGRKSGAEFLVSATTRGAQSSPSPIALPDGGFVIAWTDAAATGDGGGSAIRAQRFSTDGRKVGPDFVMNATTQDAQRSPNLAVLGDGTLVAAWTDNSATGADTDGSAVRARLFAVTPDDPARRLLWNGGGDCRDLQMDPYAGPVPWLKHQFIGQPGGEAVVGSDDADFLNLLDGDDAADGRNGDDVPDGGSGSNFLTGGAGNDTFFVDGRVGGRVGVTTWSTVTDMTAGEWATAWGWTPGTSTITWADMQGAEGFKGATAHIDIDGNGSIDLSVTFAGKSAGSLLTTAGQSGADRYLAFTLA